MLFAFYSFEQFTVPYYLFTPYFCAVHQLHTMKKILPSLIVIVFFACNNNSANTPPQGGPEESDSGIYYAYSPIYSNGYKTGSYKNLKMVTDVWKQYENGDITKSAGTFADDITFVYPDQVISGKKDSVLGQVKKLRNGYATVQSFIYSWMPAKAKDHDEDWVFIWGRQEYNDKEGKLKSIEVHEIWQFNKEGKIIFMQQYHTRHS